MSLLTFTKMNGAGNDFVMLDNRAGAICLSREQIAHLCERHRGVGGDGLILVESGDRGLLRMRYFNSDGGEAEMCGNGARCFARFAASLEGDSPTQLAFETLAGTISADLLADGRVRLAMGRPNAFVPVRDVEVNGSIFAVWSINTGVPHAVVEVSEIASIDVVSLGSALRYHPAFAPAGTNVNFLQKDGPGCGLIRTYERGVEAETLACGTGVVASALVLGVIQNHPGPIKIRVRGGEWLEVGFEGKAPDWDHVTLCGPADFSFTGTIAL